MTARARPAGRFGDELTVGWVGRHKPEKAVNQYDDGALGAWARGYLKIAVRIGPRADNQARVYH